MYSRGELESRVNALPWFHQIDFGNGIISPGVTPLKVLKAQADVYFSRSIAGKSVLDVGCWDGFNSFEAKRRGARRVLATDHFTWSDIGWGKRESFDLARSVLCPDVEVMDIDLPEISEKTVGRFDVVLFLGVLYHLPNPFAGLQIAASVCDEWIVIETHLDALHVRQPAAIFYTDGHAGDWTNFWGPNPACVTGMMHRLKFDCEHLPHPVHKNRGIFFATRRR
jgi:tRNA (mo5U34)-methyltransferase